MASPAAWRAPELMGACGMDLPVTPCRVKAVPVLLWATLRNAPNPIVNARISAWTVLSWMDACGMDAIVNLLRLAGVITMVVR